jgi:hypothetical protein
VSYTPVLVKRYWNVLTLMGCSVTGADHDVTIHHCHGGSMVERGFERAFGRKTSDWLVIPLVRILHVGPGGIDGFPRPSVDEWEAKHGRQADYIDQLVLATGIDVWQLARDEERGMVERWIA